MRLFALAAAPLLVVAVPAQALPQRLPPVDQCKSDVGFERFRGRLKQVVAKKDRAALLALLAPDVLVNFGGASGREAFDQEWDLAQPDDRNIWGLLGKVLRGGCARSDQARIIPSLLIQLDPYEGEDLSDKVIILPGAKLYAMAGVESRNPATTPWAVAIVTSRAADWGTGVRLADGREGYIPDDDLFEPLGYRMTIEKRSGKWMITAFVAGD